MLKGNHICVIPLGIYNNINNRLNPLSKAIG